MKLPPFDLASASLDPGIVLLEASAGTGKTYTLVGILLRLLLERRIERLDEALVVTFTVAATDELKRRLRDGLRLVLAVAEGQTTKDGFFASLAQQPDAATVCRRALADFDQVAVHTIHGFCKRLLDEAAFETRQPFATEFETDGLPLLYRAAADALRLQHAPPGDARGALLCLGKHTPESLVQAYRLWRRHPDVALPLTETRFASLAKSVAAAAIAAAGRWHDGVGPRLAALPWKKTSTPIPGDFATGLTRLLARIQRDPIACLSTLVAFAPGALAQSYDKRRLKNASFDDPFFEACGELAGRVDEALAHLRVELLLAMRQRVEQAKQDDQVATFDDLLVRAHEALHDEARSDAVRLAIRARHQVALIDEFQDTDALQYAIFSTCFHDRTLFLIGDPKQAIYGFRGADLRTYLRARSDAHRAFTLDANFRSAKSLVDAVNTLFGDHPLAFVDPGIAAQKVRAAAAPHEKRIAGDGEAVLRWRWVPLNPEEGRDKKFVAQRICADVAAEAARLLQCGATVDDAPLRPQDLAVLVRANWQAIAIQDCLRSVGIPSAIGKAGDVLTSEEVDELRRVLLAILRPGDLRLVRAAMATRLYGLDLAGLRALDASEGAFDAAVEQFAGWRTRWQRHGFMAMAADFADDRQLTARCLGWHDGERRLTNLRQLWELLHGAETAHRLPPEALLRWFEQEAHAREEVGEELREMRLESDEDAVQILTAHRSKGLQYEVTFCPFLWDRRAPHGLELEPTAAGHRVAFDVTADDPAAAAIARERLEEDVRLAYVALTRAKRRSYVHLGPIGRDCAGSPLAWLVGGRDQAPPAGAAFLPWLVAFQANDNSARPAWRAALATMAEQSGGAVAVDDVPAQPATARLPAPPAAKLPALRRPTRIVEARAQASFTSMTAQREGDAAARDVVDDEPRPVAVADAPPQPASGIHAFARGAAASICLHTLLERADLRAPDAPVTTALVRQTLADHGLLAPAAHAGPIDPVADVVAMLRGLAGAVVPPAGCTLAELTAGDKQAEWDFLLPLAADRAGLAATLAKSASPIVREQGQRLARMQPHALRGFLVGSADLVCEHAGRYWILDWKSNHLGNRREDYGAAALRDAMLGSDYVLQYSLYALALHRQLVERLPGYAPERHLGGVCYAFVRGVAAGSDSGLFCDAIDPAMVHALDEWARSAKTEARP